MKMILKYFETILGKPEDGLDIWFAKLNTLPSHVQVV